MRRLLAQLVLLIGLLTLTPGWCGALEVTCLLYTSDAADRFANAVGINSLQGHFQGSAPARSEREQADEQNELGEQATHHRTACS